VFFSLRYTDFSPAEVVTAFFLLWSMRITVRGSEDIRLFCWQPALISTVD
jgi:hypothetical protein